MEVVRLEIPEVRFLKPVRHGDVRGWFSEVYRKDQLAKAGINSDFVQDNQSFSAPVGTIRGLHYQLPPFAQAKLVRVLQGSILDVVVDIRRASPTFGRHVAVCLDAEQGQQLYVPAGFAHGFCTLEPNTMIAYKVDAYYSREHDRGIRWNDPALGIDWKLPKSGAVLSEKDKAAPLLSEATTF